MICRSQLRFAGCAPYDARRHDDAIASERSELQGIDEGGSRRGEQRSADRAGQRPAAAPPHRPAWPSRPRPRPAARRPAWRRQARARYSTVPRLPNTRDAERAAEFGRWFPTAPMPRPARSGGAAVMIISLPIVNTGAMPEAHHHGAGDQQRPAHTAVGQRQHARSRRAADGQPPHQHVTGRHAPRQSRRQQRARRRSQRPRQRRQPGLQRRQAEHQLQVLRDEDVDAEHRQARQRIRGDRGAEARLAEQLQLQQRVREPALPAHEQRADGQARASRQPAPRQREAVLGDLLQAVDRRRAPPPATAPR